MTLRVRLAVRRDEKKVSGIGRAQEQTNDEDGILVCYYNKKIT